MRLRLIQTIGIALTVLYGALILWLYATEPRTLREVAAGAQVAVGAYQVDAAKFDEGLALFRRDEFKQAREAWAQADVAGRDARTQFYIAYSFYRQGWGRVYHDDNLFKQGLEAVNRAITLSPDGASLAIDDADLRLHTAGELKAELERGINRSWSDLNPLKVLRERK